MQLGAPFAYSVLILAALLYLLLFSAERLFPLRARKAHLFHRVILNLSISALVFLIAVYVVRPLATMMIGWNTTANFGLIHLWSLPNSLQILLAFVLMDLTFYYWHQANHHIPFLWRFHNVHHSDPDLDVTTGFRFHCVETLLSTGFRVLQVVFIGVPLSVYVAYEVALQCATMFHHSNVRLPIGFERFLSWLVVTPRMHGIHHSVVRSEANSNFSTVFSWWDRLHATIRLNIPQNQIRIGVPAYSSVSNNRFWALLLQPFRKQKQDWLFANGQQAVRDPKDLPGSRHYLIE